MVSLLQNPSPRYLQKMEVSNFGWGFFLFDFDSKKLYNKCMEKKIKKLFEEGHSNLEIATELKVSLSTVKRRLKSMNLRRTPEQRSKLMSQVVKACYESGKIVPLSGDKCPTKRPDVRKKISQGLKTSEKAKLGRELAKQTMLEKYGVDNAFKSEKFKQKIRETCLRKYGVTNAMQSESVRRHLSEKLKKVKRNQYNWETRADRLKDYYEENGKILPKELMKLWGVNESNTYRFLREYKLEKYVELKASWLEAPVERFLKENNISYEKHTRTVIPPQEIDFFIPEFNLALECNDVYSHNSTRNAFGGKPKNKNYHFNKSRKCEEKGIRLIHIWDYEWFDDKKEPILKSMILGACNKAETIYARKCTIEIRKSAEMRQFFEENNIAGFRGGKFAICLVYQGEVVMSYLMGYSYLARGQQELEVIRGATKLNTRVIGGASKLWKHLIEEYNPSSIVYYIDFNYFNGNSLPHLGLKYVSSQAGFKNYFRKTKTVHNRQPVRHREIKELVKQDKVWEIWNAGVKKYVWENPNLES